MIVRRTALAALDQKPGVWHCIRCWAAALGAGEEDYADLRDLVRSIATGRGNLMYETVHNQPGEIACDVESAVCEKKVTGLARYSGWRWSVRRRRE